MSTVSAGVRAYGHLINGQEVGVDEATIERCSPATGELLARFADGTASDVAAAAGAARSAFDAGPWPRLSGAERSQLLLALAEEVREHHEQLARIDAEEVGKPIRLARADVDGAIVHFEYAAALAHDVHGDTYSNLGPQYLGLIMREPVGVAGLIAPWNFPIVSYGEKVPYALAAGCTVVLKPSELTSGTALEVTKLAAGVGIPDGVINVVTGYGDPVGQALVGSGDVDFVSFTGSTATGRRIAQTAAEGPKRVSLELGGKGANVIFADADLDDALDGALFAVFFNAGECCVAGTRLIVEDTIADELVRRLVDRTRGLRVGMPFDETADVGALIHEQHAEKVLSYIRAGQREGADLLTGGGRLAGELARGAFVEPTIFDSVRPEMSIFREEIFGPVLCVSRFCGAQEAIELANHTSYGLGNTVWTKNVDNAVELTRNLRSGTVWVNTTIDSAPQMTFGGLKASGYGRETGRAGLEEYTQLKSCVIRTGKRDPFFTVNG
jgi:betaine-aldehyde dehydrogenase